MWADFFSFCTYPVVQYIPTHIDKNFICQTRAAAPPVLVFSLFRVYSKLILYRIIPPSARVENLTLQIYDCSLFIFFFSCKLSYHFLLFYTLCNLKIFLLRFMLICFLILLFFRRRECAGLGDGRKNWSIPI